MIFRKIKNLNKRNSGNRTPRNENQRKSAVKIMILHNPLKKPLNRINQSQRMVGNSLWKQRKKELIKQQPSAQVAGSL